MEKPLSLLPGFTSVVGFFGAQRSECSIVDPFNHLTCVFLLLQRNRQQPVNQKICIPSDWTRKVGIAWKVQPIMLVVLRFSLINRHILCLSQTSQKLPINHIQKFWRCRFSQSLNTCTQSLSIREVDPFDVNCLEESFELTPAFAWLELNAADFSFTMSFPRNNDNGLLYEPWHWCFQD